jgi:hypothetical protein
MPAATETSVVPPGFLISHVTNASTWSVLVDVHLQRWGALEARGGVDNAEVAKLLGLGLLWRKDDTYVIDDVRLRVLLAEAWHS